MLIQIHARSRRRKVHVNVSDTVFDTRDTREQRDRVHPHLIFTRNIRQTAIRANERSHSEVGKSETAGVVKLKKSFYGFDDSSSSGRGKATKRRRLGE